MISPSHSAIAIGLNGHCKRIPSLHGCIKQPGNGEVVNLFMDYETFGEHQWEETGIFEF